MSFPADLLLVLYSETSFRSCGQNPQILQEPLDRVYILGFVVVLVLVVALLEVALDLVRCHHIVGPTFIVYCFLNSRSSEVLFSFPMKFTSVSIVSRIALTPELVICRLIVFSESSLIWYCTACCRSLISGVLNNLYKVGCVQVGRQFAGCVGLLSCISL